MNCTSDFQVTGLNPSVVSGATSGIQYFPRVLGASIGVQSVAPSATSSLGQLGCPGDGKYEGKLFEVHVAGVLVPGTGDPSATATISISANSKGFGVAPSYTVIATSAAIAVTPSIDTPQNFFFKLKLLGNSASGIVFGTQESEVVTTYISPAVLTANLSGINMQGNAPFGLVVGVTFSTANSLNVAKLTQFQIGD